MISSPKFGAWREKNDFFQLHLSSTSTFEPWSDRFGDMLNSRQFSHSVSHFWSVLLVINNRARSLLSPWLLLFWWFVCSVRIANVSCMEKYIRAARIANGQCVVLSVECCARMLERYEICIKYYKLANGVYVVYLSLPTKSEKRKQRRRRRSTKCVSKNGRSEKAMRRTRQQNAEKKKQ